jgi:hypothetical protein
LTVRYGPVAIQVPFDNTDTALVAENVQEALVELGGKGYSQRFVAGITTISAFEEMILSDYLDLSETGIVHVDGLLTILGL